MGGFKHGGDAVSLQGVPISAVAPTDEQFLEYEVETGLWTPTTAAPSGVSSVTAADVSIVVAGTGANPTISRGALTGDVTAGAGSNATTLAAIGAAAGPIGDGTHVAQVTIDTKGRVTALASVAIAGAPPSGAAGGDLTGTYPNPTLGAAGPGATGPIGATGVIPVITIDAKGRVTALTSVATVGTVTAADTSIVVAGTGAAPTISRAALTGDITAPAGNNATTLKNTGPGATGPIGDATHVSAVTIDAQGRVTALTSVAITGAALTFASGVLGANNTLVANTDTLLMTTASLAIGTWLVAVGANIQSAAAAATAIELIAGTATVSAFGGPSSAEANTTSAPATSPGDAINFTVLVTITVAGTLLVNAKSTGTPTLRQFGNEYGAKPVTGWTAIKVA